MDHVFLETSAFLKLYRPEKGSVWLQSYISGKRLVISQLVFAETTTALGRLYREGIYTKKQATKLYARIINERSQYEVILLGAERQINNIASLAFNLPTTTRLRALDGFHIAVAAIYCNDVITPNPTSTLTFLSSDAQLLRVAQAQGFLTENPEDYT